MAKLLVTMMGYPGAGKTHFAKQLAEKIDAVVLSSESLRNVLFPDRTEQTTPEGNVIIFGIMDYAVSQILDTGISVIYDTKTNRRKERQKNARIARNHGAIPITVWIQTDKTLTFERTETREVRLDQIRLTREERVERNSDYLEEPEDSELCIIIDGTKPFSDQFESFQTQLQRLSNHVPRTF